MNSSDDDGNSDSDDDGNTQAEAGRIKTAGEVAAAGIVPPSSTVICILLR